MRATSPAYKLLAFTCFASLLILPAHAQTASAPAPAAPMVKLFSAAADLPAAIAKLKAARVGDQPLVVEPRLLSLPPYRVQLEYRPGIAPATVHEKDAEMMYILEGTGTIVTGGKLVGETRTNADNLAGTSIADGKPQAIAPGDVVLIPENTPHQVTPKSGAAIVIMSVHMPRPAQAGWSWP